MVQFWFRASRLTGVMMMLGMIALWMLPAWGAEYYTVQAGESLSVIAARYSVSLNELCTLNGIDDATIVYSGQVLRLPEGAVTGKVQLTTPPIRLETTPSAPQPLSGRALIHERTRLLTTDKGAKIVSAARAFSGTRYRWGGLSSRGIDCSGLVVRAMGAQGINVPHNAAQLYRMGVKVSYAQLQPGDLLFFNTFGRGITHVGIWVGNNKFIHASSGRGVITDSVSGFYARTLVGARRL